MKCQQSLKPLQSQLVPLVLFCSSLTAMEFEDRVLKYEFNIQGGYATIAQPPKHTVWHGSEDQFDFKLADEIVPYCAVFDGNGGAKAATLLKDNFFFILKHNIVNSAELYPAVENAFHQAHQLVLNKGDTSGSTLTAAFFTTHNGKLNLHVAHVGDTLAILGTLQDDQTIVATELTPLHRHSNAMEMNRINSMTNEVRKHIYAESSRRMKEAQSHRDQHKPRSRNGLFTPRNLFGAPKPTTEPQDQTLQLPLDSDFDDDISLTRCIAHEYLHYKGVIATPEITTIELEPEHQFLIILTDGAHDHLPSQTAVEIVWPIMQQGSFAQTAAFNLAESAARSDPKNRMRHDRDFNRVKQNIRDDITAMVLFFTRSFPAQ